MYFIVSGEVEVDVESGARRHRMGAGEFFGEVVAVLFRVGAGGVGGDADLAGLAEGGLALEGDDVGRRGVGEEAAVQVGLLVVGEEGEGELALRAAAVEAVASTGGQLMPPIMGAAAFVMAEFLAVPYAQVALWAVVPSFLYYTAVLFAVHFEAKRHRLAFEPAGGLP